MMIIIIVMIIPKLDRKQKIAYTLSDKMNVTKCIGKLRLSYVQMVEGEI